MRTLFSEPLVIGRAIQLVPTLRGGALFVPYLAIILVFCLYEREGVGQMLSMRITFLLTPARHCFCGNISRCFASNNCEEALEMGVSGCDRRVCIDATDRSCAHESARGTWPRLVEHQLTAAGDHRDAPVGVLRLPLLRDALAMVRTRGAGVVVAGRARARRAREAEFFGVAPR